MSDKRTSDEELQIALDYARETYDAKLKKYKSADHPKVQRQARILKILEEKARKAGGSEKPKKTDKKPLKDQKKKPLMDRIKSALSGNEEKYVPTDDEDVIPPTHVSGTY